MIIARFARALTRVAVALPVAALIAACSASPKVESAEPSSSSVRDTAFLSDVAIAAAGVTVDSVRRELWRETWQLPARLTLDPTVTQALGSIVEGRVTQVLVQVGDRVRRGQVLVTIHSHELTDAHNALAQARAGRTEADNAAQLAGFAVARSERLFAAQAGSMADLERARAAKVAAEAGQRRATAEFERASELVAHLRAPGALSSAIDPEDVIVRAPFDGVIVAREAQPGAVVTPGAALITVSRTGSILLAMHVPESALSAAVLGAEVQFTVPAYPARTFTARVTRVSPTLDSLTRTAEVFAAVANRDGDLRAEMTAAASLFEQGRDSTFVVPAASVQDFEGDTVVVTGVPRQGGLLLEAVRVHVGRRATALSELTNGGAVRAPVVHGGAAVAKAEILRQRDARAGAQGGAPE